MAEPLKICKKGLHKYLGGACNECARERGRRRYLNKKDECKDRNAKWYKKNKEKVKEKNLKNKEEKKIYNLKYRLANRDKLKEKYKEYRLLNIDKIRKKDVDKVKEISDSYIAGIFGLKVSQVPKELFELHRIQLQIKRKIKELKK